MGSAQQMMLAQRIPPAGGAPTLNSATIPSAGNVMNLVFSASVTIGAGGNGGVTTSMSGGAATLTYASGSGSTTLVYTISRTVNVGETGTLAYTQPGNGIEATTGGADVVTFSGFSVTNSSTQGASNTVTGTLLDAATSTTANVLISTASVTPTANHVVLVAMATVSATAGLAAAPVSGSGAGITFAQRAGFSPDGSSVYFSLWYGVTASPTTGALTFNFTTNESPVCYAVIQLGGEKATGTNGVDVFGANAAGTNQGSASTTGTATIGTFGSTNNGAFSAWVSLIGGTTIPTATPDTGWTELSDQGGTVGGISSALEIQIRATNDTSAAAGFSASVGVWGGIACELVAA